MKDDCLSHLVVWNDIWVNEHHYYEICSKHMISFDVKNVELTNIDDAWQHQEDRRNLTPYHRDKFALKFKEVIAIKAKERQRGGQGGILLPPTLAEAKETCQELAEMTGVATSTLE